MRLIITVFTVLLFASCSSPRFASSPTAHNVPVLTKQQDSKLSFNYSTNADARKSDDRYNRNKANGFDIQGAYAITNHIGVQASYFSRGERTYAKNDNYFDSSVVKYKRNLFEFGAGYFAPIDKTDKMFFQVFAGVGFGKFNFTDNGKDKSQLLYSRFHNADITKFYLEPAVTYKSASEVFAASLSTRFSVIKFRKVQTNYSTQERDHFNLDSIGRFSSIFFEPAFINSYGFNQLPGLRLEYQIGLSLLMSRNIIDYRTFNFSIGLVLDIPKLMKAAAKKND